MKKNLRQRIFGVLFGAGLLGWLGLAIFSPEWGVLKDRNKPRFVPTAKVRIADVTDALYLRGKVTAPKVIPVLAQTGGQVIAVHADEGEEVTQGQVLVELDQKQFQAEYEKAKLRMDKIVIEMTQSLGELEKQKALFKENLVPQMELDRFEKTHELAKVDYDIARKDLVLMEDQIQKSNVTAPISGVVTKRGVEPGQVLAPIGSESYGKPLFEITDVSEKRVSLSVHETDRVHLEVGKPVRFWLETSSNEKRTGKIAKISSAAISDKDGESGGFLVEVTGVDSFDDRFILGLSSQVEVVLAEARQATTVPLQAVRRDKKGEFAWVMNPNGFERRPIETGIMGTMLAQITKGLAAREIVALEDPEIRR